MGLSPFLVESILTLVVSESQRIGYWCWKRQHAINNDDTVDNTSDGILGLVYSLPHVITASACEVGRAEVINVTVLVSNEA